MSILYHRRLYPEARIIGFEPDPAIFQLLQENLRRNDVAGVKLINAGLGGQPGKFSFIPDGTAGGRFGEGKNSMLVKVEPLSPYLAEPVDFVKLNIEGQELSVLEEAAACGRLVNVRQLVLEYHGWANGPQRLGDILNLLDREGFRYLVHDFDRETGAASKPPFRKVPEQNWFCLVYGRRKGPI
jgi:FkbM family methyltransferase